MFLYILLLNMDLQRLNEKIKPEYLILKVIVISWTVYLGLNLEEC